MILAWVPPVRVPVELGREEAAALARQELADPVYGAAQPSLPERALAWLLERLSDLLDRATSASPGGAYGLLGLVVLLVLVVVAIRWRVGAVRRSRAGGGGDFGDERRSAAALRDEAERLAARGAWDEAVRARLRAVVADLEERGVLDRRPGRTADEVATDAGAVLPTAAASLRTAAVTFDDVWYGGRAADDAAYRRIVEADTRVRAAKPVAQPTPAPAVLAVPR